MKTDPIADCLTRIRNAQKAKHPHVQLPFSSMKKQILDILKQEGFVQNVETFKDENMNMIRVALKYDPAGKGVIHSLTRVSKPGRRWYSDKETLVKNKDVITTTILTTSKGVMTDRKACEMGIGGEVICKVS